MTIVEAVGISVGSMDPSKNELAAKIAEAQRQAVIKAQAEGIADPIIIRERIAAAKNIKEF